MKNRILKTLGFLLFGVVAVAFGVGVSRTGILDYTGISSAPTNPPTGLGRVYYNTTTKALACLNPDGTACLASPSVSGLTTGFLPKAASATSLGNSLCDEGITTANQLTCTDTAGLAIPSVSTGSSPPVITPGTSGVDAYHEGTAPTIPTGADGVYGSSSDARLHIVNNGVEGGGLFGIVYSNTAAAQTSPITDTTMVTVAGGTKSYRFSGNVGCDSASAAATASLNLKYTDVGNHAESVTITSTCTTLGTGSVADMVHFIRALNGTAITWGITIANTPTYDADVRLELM